MKILNNIILLSLFAALSFTFIACENSTNNKLEDYPYIVNTINDEYRKISCSEPIKLTFNKRIKFTKSELESSFLIIREVLYDYNYDNSNYRTRYDTLSPDYFISEDGYSLYIQPDTIHYNNTYYIAIHDKYLYEEMKLNRLRKYSISRQEYRLGNIVTKSVSNNDTIPRDLKIRNWNNGYGAFSDTLKVGVIDKGYGFKFIKWENIDSTFMTPEGNILKIIATCQNMPIPKEVYAIYEKIQ